MTRNLIDWWRGKNMLLAAASRGVWKPVELHLQKRNSAAKKETETPTAEPQPVLVALKGVG